MTIISAVIYFILAVITAVQAYRWKDISKDLPKEVAFPKTLALALCFIFSLSRGAYFSIPPSVLALAQFAIWLFEIPGLLFFIMYTCLLYIWATAIYNSRRIIFKNFAPRTLRLFMGINAVMILSFIIFIIVFFTTPMDPKLPCQITPTSYFRQRQQVNFAYVVFLGVLSLLMAILVFALASYLLYLIGFAPQHKSLRRLRNMTLFILISFPPMFAIRTGLLIFAALGGSVVIPLMVFTFLEVFPSVVLLYYIIPITPSAIHYARVIASTHLNSPVERSIDDTAASLGGAGYTKRDLTTPSTLEIKEDEPS
jgi:hypothetical protein